MDLVNSMNRIGKVYIVGAGPGNIGMLTYQAEWAISSADIIVYDALVSPEIVALFPENTEKLFVGKRGGKHTLPQEQICERIIEEANKGKTVVRLKGGDPFMFGRGGEEVGALAAAGGKDPNAQRGPLQGSAHPAPCPRQD